MRAREATPTETLAQALYETWTRPKPGVVALHDEGPAPPWGACALSIKDAWRELAAVALTYDRRVGVLAEERERIRQYCQKLTTHERARKSKSGFVPKHPLWSAGYQYAMMEIMNEMDRANQQSSGLV